MNNDFTEEEHENYRSEEITFPRNLISLYEASGSWSEPYYEAGYNIFEIDLQNDPSINAHDLNFEWFVENVFENVGGCVDIILSGPPCTDFTVSGAQYWPAKDADGRTAASLELVSIALQAIEALKPDWWCLENPVGRLPKLIAKEHPYWVDLFGEVRYFNPWEYAGYLDIDHDRAKFISKKRLEDITAEDIQFVKDSNLYTKKTGLWGNFVMPDKRPIPPIKVCNQGSWLQKLGGKSDKTKNERSLTPAGFAKAFFEANA